jgi:hypothetical protein
MPSALLLLALLPALLAAGCGSDSSGREAGHGTVRPPHSTALVDASRPPYVTALAVDPGNGAILIATNRGLFRVPRGGGAPVAIRARAVAGRAAGPYGKKVSAFAFTAPDRLVGSGHPDGAGKLPGFLGTLKSSDGGRTWRAVSRVGFSDLHVVGVAGPEIYAFDTALGATIVSRDGGRRFSERQAPRGPALAMAADPADPNYLLAATATSLARSTDGGGRWTPLGDAQGAQLVWTSRGLVRTVADGTVSASSDRGASWRSIGHVPGAAAKLTAGADGALYAAMLDGAVETSRDGGRTWKEVPAR